MTNQDETTQVADMYLGDGVYAQFKHDMIGLYLRGQGNPSVIWLEWPVYNTLRTFAKRVGFEGEQPQ